MAIAPVLAVAPFPYAGEVAAALSALLWASSGVVFARIHPPVSAFAINLGKNVTSCVCFVLLVWILTGAPLPVGLPREPLLWFIASGVLGLAICDTFLMRSLLAIGPQRMSLIFTMYPVIVAIGAILPPFREHPGTFAWAGMGLCLGGIVLAVLEEPKDARHRTHYARGVRDAVIAALCQAAAILTARHGLNLADIPGEEGAAVRMIAGTLGLVVIGLPAMRVVTWSKEVIQRHVGFRVAGAAFFGTFLGIWLNQLGLKWAEHTGVATVLNSLMPVYLIPLSALFLGARITRRGLTATMVTIAGVVVMTLLS
ncbi:MAG: DMT family transporter [Planctomycetota bacterium]|nr:DMT family transporter [Planctomycetota bacterium]